MDKEIFKLDIGGKELKVEISKLAEQASGSALVQYGDTTVLATAVMSPSDKEDRGFFPLTVEYEERFYAAGKILGSRFLRRESRPADEAILTARFIDRAIRPRFPKNFKREVQVVVTCLSWDKENDPDIIGLIAASISLSISDIPWLGPISAIRIGQVDGKLVINPTYKEREKGNMEIALAATFSPLAKFLGNKDNDDLLINMIEAEGNEIEEDVFFSAVKFAKPSLETIINFQKEIVAKVGKDKLVIAEKTEDAELEQDIKQFLGSKLEDALFLKNRADRMAVVNALKTDLIYFIEGKYPGLGKGAYTANFFEEEINNIIHEKIIKEGKRSDGRKLDEVRELKAEVGLLPRTHGSGLFVRGQTQALSILTLGAPDAVRLIEGMEFVGKKRFMHHYNFPPFCSGEVKPMRGPGRREIGHGMLAEKALLPLIPNFEEFPYTIRIVTEILSSNGSTSMASVSASSLALMDAGVPIKSPATGIALGLMTDLKGPASAEASAGKNYKILTDIQGPEDHHGDMDFKIAGTKNGITAIQMDVKIEGIGDDIIEKTLAEGKKARLHILETIIKVIAEPRKELSPFAPRIITLQINPSKIREVIGPGGKMINEIIAECGVAIDIEDSGIIFITAEKEESGKKAAEWIKNLTREVLVGEIFEGQVKRILEFGAFVEILPGQDGLVHISQLADHRVEKVEDIVNIGDTVTVKVISIDDQGRINLSLKEAKK
ncbi:MAG: polyribonucleotide nucleotidyltransferase [Candidatus Azambacteria bacterium]|nr:polyribonucleotide nucleotidyltransferase [Candidatus Azambacteria bacterium]